MFSFYALKNFRNKLERKNCDKKSHPLVWHAVHTI